MSLRDRAIPRQLGVNIGQPSIGAIVGKSQLLVVDSQKVQYGGVKIVVGNRIFDRFPAPFVGGPERDPSLDSSAGHPTDGSPSVVISPFAPLEKGMRPNSVFHKRIVSSNKPLALRSDKRAAVGRSVAMVMGGNSLTMLAWLSQFPVGPLDPLHTCTTRTPRSIKRLASKHRRPKSSVAGSPIP